MTRRYDFTIEAEKGQSLTKLYLLLAQTHEGIVNKFSVFEPEKKKGSLAFFGSGEAVIQKLKIVWEAVNLTQEEIDTILSILENVKKTGIGKVRAEYENDTED